MSESWVTIELVGNPANLASPQHGYPVCKSNSLHGFLIVNASPILKLCLLIKLRFPAFLYSLCEDRQLSASYSPLGGRLVNR